MLFYVMLRICALDLSKFLDVHLCTNTQFSAAVVPGTLDSFNRTLTGPTSLAILRSDSDAGTSNKGGGFPSFFLLC